MGRINLLYTMEQEIHLLIEENINKVIKEELSINTEVVSITKKIIKTINEKLFIATPSLNGCLSDVGIFSFIVLIIFFVIETTSVFIDNSSLITLFIFSSINK